MLETKEEDKVVAFIDVLGFRHVMKGSDVSRRHAAFQLMERVSSYGSKQGVKVTSFGFAASLSNDPEISTFSDNIVISAPTADISYKGVAGPSTTPASMFVENPINSIISIVWQGLHFGFLFRGAITTGLLYHNQNVVAGEALVKAVEMENPTIFPRIEIEPSVLTKKDSRGMPLVGPLYKEIGVIESDGRYYLNTLGFHVGVWWDYGHFRTGEPKCTPDEIRDAIWNSDRNIDSNIEMLKRARNEASSKDHPKIEKALEKWSWFKSYFEASKMKSDWNEILRS